MSGVAAVSARYAWAVGSIGSGKTLILHWNGATWKKVPSPTPSPTPGWRAQLGGVAVVSARSAWAVGTSYPSRDHALTLILHWNGASWKEVPSLTLPAGGVAFLQGVAIVSARNAWAVGNGCDVVFCGALILHWNGRTWRRVPSPAGDGAGLNSVAATSAR